ncbi:hypothetical protein A6M27_12265 [Acidithiobacillus thiooxidans]|uniref:DNA polymerase III beta sliding clamp subunit n=2 Tax=Acidithiobacillus thiooxidans TaxID=930 RepID=A0A1C2I0A7_ACITH|nr:hypothetical protein A6O24_18530 [Acidithiobacillus thiooxidans]OCX72321.1 hypothetical protein A6P07_10165 [Acidithiobacillus thiooxidans]OCX79312.1 hypothetical protein A6O26_16870 [Acidithiobacillus thiooxidans]OCX86597.1 hypothetical protein A6M27_12265 [Acidithiobacillus thiooxidans]OFC42206.1 hypothetical protein BAE47_16215 [Acidithiobacillus thiooxidans]
MKINHDDFLSVAKIAAILGENGFDFKPEYFLALSPYTAENIMVHVQSGPIQARMSLPVTENTMGDKGFCLPRNECVRFLGASNSDTVSIQVDDRIARIRSGRSSMKAVTISIDSFPLAVPIGDTLLSIEVDATTLKAALALAVVGNTGLGEPQGVYFHPYLGDLHIYSTDGKVISHSAIKMDMLKTDDAKHENASTVPLKIAQTLLKAFKHFDKERIQIHFTENGLIFSDVGNTWNIHTQIVDNPKRFPWEAYILNAKYVLLCVITDNERMTETLDISTSISSDKLNAIALSVAEDNILSLSMNNDRGESKSAFEVETHNPYQMFTSSAPVHAFLGFCRKYGNNGVLHLGRLDMPNTIPLKLSYEGDDRFVISPSMSIAPCTG